MFVIYRPRLPTVILCNKYEVYLHPVGRKVSGKSGPKDQVALHYYYTSPSRGIEIVNFTTATALSAGTQYRLVQAHFYP